MDLPCRKTCQSQAFYGAQDMYPAPPDQPSPHRTKSVLIAEDERDAAENRRDSA